MAIAKQQLLQDRFVLEEFIDRNPLWESIFEPIRTLDTPPIIEAMEIPTEICGVGPMAAVAGAFSRSNARSNVKTTQGYHRRC